MIPTYYCSQYDIIVVLKSSRTTANHKWTAMVHSLNLSVEYASLYRVCVHISCEYILEYWLFHNGHRRHTHGRNDAQQSYSHTKQIRKWLLKITYN